MNEEQIFAIERPHPNLLKLYIIRAILTGPFLVITLPYLLCRYYSLRYRFDSEGIGMKWGVLFRREVNLTYARIQDIHVLSGVIQRWFELADLQIQTASGSASAEMVVEGMLEFADVRDFLYTRMRGYRDKGAATAMTVEAGAGGADGEVVELLHEIRDELRQAREALEARPAPGEDSDHV